MISFINELTQMSELQLTQIIVVINESENTKHLQNKYRKIIQTDPANTKLILISYYNKLQNNSALDDRLRALNLTNVRKVIKKAEEIKQKMATGNSD